jgi:hypothetical protein
MKNQQKKNPFSPIELDGADVDWFSDYLNGKVVNSVADKRRKEILKKASEIEENTPLHV